MGAETATKAMRDFMVMILIVRKKVRKKDKLGYTASTEQT